MVGVYVGIHDFMFIFAIEKPQQQAANGISAYVKCVIR